MSLKSQMAAMSYLAKVKPKEYRLKRSGYNFELQKFDCIWRHFHGVNLKFSISY